MKRVIAAALLLVGIVVLALVGMLQPRFLQATYRREPLPPSYPFDEARAIAAKDLLLFRSHMMSTPKDFGLSAEEEISRTVLGRPYLSYVFVLPSLADDAYRSSSFFEQLVDGGHNIHFPVLVDGEGRTSMTVMYADQKWQSGSWGGYNTRTLVKLQRQLVQEGFSGRVDLVIFPPFGADFGLIEDQGALFLIPLHDPLNMFPSLDFRGTQRYKLEAVLPLLHEQARIDMDNANVMSRTMLAMPTSEPQQEPPPDDVREIVEPPTVQLPPATMTALPVPGAVAATPDTSRDVQRDAGVPVIIPTLDPRIPVTATPMPPTDTPTP
jgi:hypothetical protein